MSKGIIEFNYNETMKYIAELETLAAQLEKELINNTETSISGFNVIGTFEFRASFILAGRKCKPLLLETESF